MEFWGVEVKSGIPLLVEPGVDMLLHISQIALGEKNSISNEPVQLFVKIGDQKLLIGTLSRDKIPHLSTEIILEKRCELSHNWRDGSVFFTGYKVDACEPEDNDDEPTPAESKEPAAAKSGVKQVNFQLPIEDVKAKNDDEDEESDDESDDDTSSEDARSEEEKNVTAEVGSDEEDEDDSSDDDEDDSSDDETSEKKRAEETKKRPAEANTSKGSSSNKKAKFVTPEKSETKKPHVHIATPHPSKQGGKNSGSNAEASNQQQTPKSGGAIGCKSCNRTFGSEMGLQSHSKAKHSAPA